MDDRNVFELGEICLFYEHFLMFYTNFQLTLLKGKTNDGKTWDYIVLNIKL